eukprot:9178722-Ditylum_brightwellii.AAC.1
MQKGDNVDIKEANNLLRVLTNNVNGLLKSNNGGELLKELTVLKELKVSAATLQETNKNSK